jgi:CspA family cold shock protein
LVTGRVLQFDQMRGYGFVAADDGGDDVFLHSSVFDGDPNELAPGTKVEFKVMAGDRGRKAFAAHLIADEPGKDQVPAAWPLTPLQPFAGPRPGPATPPIAPSGPVPSPPLARVSTASASPAPDQGQKPEPEPEQLCDVLSSVELGQELTELLLSNVPSLTGQQVLEIRQSVLESARKHGWVDL